MNLQLIASLAFSGGGLLLSAGAVAMLMRVVQQRQGAAKTMGTVVATWEQPIKAQPLESMGRADEPRAEAPTAKNVSAHRTRWITVSFEDTFGEIHEATCMVYGRYTPGQKIPLLVGPERPTQCQIDAPLELYGKPAVVAVMAAIFLLIGAMIWGDLLPLAGN